MSLGSSPLLEMWEPFQPMRLKSEIWVKAYLRRAASAGVPGVVAHRGDADAGVILIKIARLDGTADLFGPVPAGYQSDDGERRWTLLAGAAAEPEVDGRISRELRLDRDTWVVELEDRVGRHFLEGWLATT
ncbi:MAG: DUF1491 family protein [Hyphomicrobiaceae bacterium]|nr:DUF1491 family protein [Hyphomicrobiaceae bacterium]